jgi:N-dimethylarginine dimethylaminohydrolase
MIVVTEPPPAGPSPGQESARRVPAEAAQERIAQASEPPFLDDLAASWGRDWGASDEVGVLRMVAMRTPGVEFDVIDESAWDEQVGALVDPAGLWYWTDRAAPDLERLASQHAGLVELLRAEGVEVHLLGPRGGHFVKAMFVRDPFLSVRGGAIVGRMAVRMRRGEERDAARLLGEVGMPCYGTITGAGTLEGGSFVKLDASTAALGTSVRCNAQGAQQLAALLAIQGIELIVVALPGYTVHLDVHMAVVDVDMVLIDPVGLPYTFMQELRARGFRLIEVEHAERPWALNALTLRPGRVVMADGAPGTAERLRRHGVEVLTLPYDEVHKNGGGIHCSTNELVREPAR